MEANKSERFESRFVNVRLEKSPAIMLQGMAGSCFGVWVAHGEGRFVFRDSDVRNRILDEGLLSLTYADDEGQRTTMYVFCCLFVAKVKGKEMGPCNQSSL